MSLVTVVLRSDTGTKKTVNRMNTFEKELTIVYDTRIRPVRNVSNDVLSARVLALVLLLEPTHTAPIKGRHGSTQVSIMLR